MVAIGSGSVSRIVMDEYVRVVCIAEGLKIYLKDKLACLDMQDKLQVLGIKTRMGCNEANMWSLYVISVPDELEGNKIWKKRKLMSR